MRQIKFRGQAITGEWVYGFLVIVDNQAFILKDVGGINYEVLLETVGQFTGFKDPSGVEIYEGDIVALKAIAQIHDEEETTLIYTGVVKLIASKGACLDHPKININDDRQINYQGYKHLTAYRSKVIGNLYENPDLVE